MEQEKKVRRGKKIHCCTTQHVICNHVQEWVEHVLQAPIEATKLVFFCVAEKNFFFPCSVKKKWRKKAHIKKNRLIRKIAAHNVQHRSMAKCNKERKSFLLQNDWGTEKKINKKNYGARKLSFRELLLLLVLYAASCLWKCIVKALTPNAYTA